MADFDPVDIEVALSTAEAMVRLRGAVDPVQVQLLGGGYAGVRPILGTFGERGRFELRVRTSSVRAQSVVCRGEIIRTPVGCRIRGEFAPPTSDVLFGSLWFGIVAVVLAVGVTRVATTPEGERAPWMFVFAPAVLLLACS